MGEIKIALKKEMKTEGEHLVLEILQCRNITYKFKSPDHLPGKGREKINLHIHTRTLNRSHSTAVVQLLCEPVLKAL